MRKYLTRWNDGSSHTAVMNILGIRRLMRDAYIEKRNLQLCVFELAENDIFAIPNPLRAFYDWKFDKLSLFELSGNLVELSESSFHEKIMKGAA